MTSEDLLKEYKKIFILVVETAGEELGNDSYRKVEELLNTDTVKKIEEQLLSYDEFPLDLLIVSYVFTILIDTHTEEEIDSWCDVAPLTKRKEFLFLYDNYLKKPTRSFTAQMGLPSVTINEDLFVHRIKCKRKNQKN